MIIDISKEISDMTDEEKEAFVQCIDIEHDFFSSSTAISEKEIAIYKAILAEKNNQDCH